MNLLYFSFTNVVMMVEIIFKTNSRLRPIDSNEAKMVFGELVYIEAKEEITNLEVGPCNAIISNITKVRLGHLDAPHAARGHRKRIASCLIFKE